MTVVASATLIFTYFAQRRKRDLLLLWAMTSLVSDNKVVAHDINKYERRVLDRSLEYIDFIELVSTLDER